LGLGIGITWGLITIGAGISAMFGWAYDFVNVMDSVYIGYAPTFMGSIIGGIWAFVNGFVGGAIIASFYNLFRK